MTAKDDELLTRQALEALVAFLGLDGAAAYERLRTRLIKVLEIRVLEYRLRAAPEDLADQAIYRVARQLDEGLVIRSSDPIRYFHGVARLVLMEAARAERNDSPLPDDGVLQVAVSEPEPVEVETRSRCLDDCLEGFSTADRELILAFYGVDKGRARIEHRKRLAASLGMTPNALRVKAHRLRRHRLEPCIVECLRSERHE